MFPQLFLICTVPCSSWHRNLLHIHRGKGQNQKSSFCALLPPIHFWLLNHDGQAFGRNQQQCLCFLWRNWLLTCQSITRTFSNHYYIALPSFLQGTAFLVISAMQTISDLPLLGLSHQGYLNNLNFCCHHCPHSLVLLFDFPWENCARSRI